MFFFAANDGIHGDELWLTDGTAIGTRMVRDIAPGPASADISGITAFGNKVYFAATDNIHGRELWQSDGTESGTRLVADILPGPLGSAPADLTPARDKLYFAAFDFEHGEELWITDGTEGGTQLVVDAVPGEDDAYPHHITPVKDQVYFVVESFDESIGMLRDELWITNGTAGSSRPIDMSLVSRFFTTFSSLREFEGQLYFVGGDQRGRNGLWRVRGTKLEFIDERNLVDYRGLSSVGRLENSFLLKSYVNVGFFSDLTFLEFLPSNERFREFGATIPSGLTAPSVFSPETRIDGDVIVMNAEAEPGIVLNSRYSTDATLVRDLDGNLNSVPLQLALHNGLLFFVAESKILGYELWATDGTPEGTIVVADIAPGARDSHPSEFVQLGDSLIGRANDGATGIELWRIDVPDTIQFSRDAYGVAEDGTPLGGAIKVTRWGSLAEAVEFSVQAIAGTANGTPGDDPDFLFSTSTFQIPSGERETTIPLSIVQDDFEESDESFTLRLSVTQPMFSTIHHSARVTIADDDRLLGDLNRNGEIDRADLDGLVTKIAIPEAQFLYAADLNGDLELDLEDVQSWLELAGPILHPIGEAFQMGDADLDGDVDARDWKLSFLKYEPHSAWSRFRDFNADGFNDVSDFNIWNGNRFRTPAAAPSQRGRIPRAALARDTSATVPREDNNNCQTPRYANNDEDKFETASRPSAVAVETQIPPRRRRDAVIRRAAFPSEKPDEFAVDTTLLDGVWLDSLRVHRHGFRESTRTRQTGSKPSSLDLC